MSAVDKAMATAKDGATKKLGLVFNGKSVGNGEHIPRNVAQSAPELTLDTPNKGPYIMVELDLDAPFVNFAILGPILHWIQPSLSPGTGEPNSTQSLHAPEKTCVAEYAPPGPPPLSGPHRYLFLLYEQPEGFDGKKHGQPEGGKSFPMMKRMRYDFDAFVREAKLGEIVAANWFVSN